MHINPCLFIISRKGSNSQSASTDWASEPVVLTAKSLGFDRPHSKPRTGGGPHSKNRKQCWR